MNLHQAMALIEASVPHPEEGLPEEIFLFISRLNPLINVDLLIQNDRGETLLTWRADQHYGPGWHIPGGIIRYKELAEQRIRKTAFAELGVEVDFDPAPCWIAQTIVPSRERGHFISMLHRCRLKSDLPETRQAKSGNPKVGEWQWFGLCPPNLIKEQRVYSRFFGADSQT